MVQVMIYIYLGVCVSMILFNCVYLVLSRRSMGKGGRWLPEVRSGALLSRRQLRKLRQSETLAELEGALDACPKGAEEFLRRNREGLLALGSHYRRHTDFARAYYDYFLDKYALRLPCSPTSVEPIPSVPREVAAG